MTKIKKVYFIIILFTVSSTPFKKPCEQNKTTAMKKNASFYHCGVFAGKTHIKNVFFIVVGPLRVDKTCYFPKNWREKKIVKIRFRLSYYKTKKEKEKKVAWTNKPTTKALSSKLQRPPVEVTQFWRPFFVRPRSKKVKQLIKVQILSSAQVNYCSGQL